MSFCHSIDLSLTYPNGTQALDRVTMHVARGEAVALVGPSGCGKSTLLRIIAGLLRSSHGAVFLDDRQVAGPTRATGLMFQDPALLPWRSVEENIRLPQELGRQAGQGSEDVVPLIKLVGLQGFEHALPRELSGGMAQRTALARALVTQPELLLMDEPFGALDALTREGLTAQLQTVWRDLGTTVIMVTHSIAEAVFMADRVLVMSARPGTIVGEVTVGLNRPRAWSTQGSPVFGSAVDAVRALLR